MQIHKLYDSRRVVTTDFISIYLADGEANKKPRDTIVMQETLHLEYLHDYSFKKCCIVTVAKLVLAAWKSVIVVTINFKKFARIWIVNIKFLKLTVKTDGFAVIA